MDLQRARSVSRQGPSVTLMPLTPGSIEFLYQLAIDERVGWRWRFGGAVVRRDTFEQGLWSGVLTQLLIVSRANDALLGSAIAYNADMNNGFAYIAAGLVADAAGSGIGIEAVDLFVGHVFASYNLRKLYFEVPEFNVPQFGSAVGTILHVEGRLLKHTYYNGRFWDRYIMSLYREEYELIGEGHGLRRNWAGGGLKTTLNPERPLEYDRRAVARMERADIRAQIVSGIGLPTDLPPSAHLADIDGFDSLRHMELVALIEEIGGVLDGNGLVDFPILRTLDDAVDYCEDLLATAAGIGGEGLST